MHWGLTTNRSCGIISTGRKNTHWRKDMRISSKRLLTFPFTSATAEEHMKALKSYNPYPISADKGGDDPEDYCVGGGLCRYVVGEITNWQVDQAFRDVKDIIFKAYDEEDDATYNDIQFPNHSIVGEALNYIAYQNDFKDRIYRRISDETPVGISVEVRIQGFFNWLGSGVIHFNDLEQFGHSWDWVETAFNKELLDMRLEQYMAELNGSPSHIYRTEDW